MKKKKFAIILLILIALLSVLGVSYAVWRITDTQTEFNQVGSKCFELTMTNESEAINLEKTYPISDEEGLSTTGYTFTVKNTCNTYATYTVDLEDLVTEAKRLSGKYIKVSVNDGTPEKLIEYQEKEPTLEEADKAYELTSGSLAPEEEATYTIKLWMDYDTPALEETINATFLSKITINAGYIEEGALENELTLRIESQTEQVNNQEEVFKIIGTSEKYNIIEYSEDNTHWTRVEPTKQLEMLKSYTEEGSYKFYIKDEVGNTKEIEIILEKLDKTAPEIEITPVDNQETIELSITLTDKNGIGGYAITESGAEPSEWNNYEGTISYTITENKTYYIWAKDSVGNVTRKEITVSTIDTMAPELTITNTLTDWGIKDTIVISATDDIIGITGVSLSTSEGEYNWEEIESTLSYETTKEVTENGTYYISVKDKYEHITTKSIVIDKIDGTAPVLSSINNSSNGEWAKSANLTWTITEEESGIDKVEYSTDNASWYALEEDNWYSIDFSEERNDVYSIRVTDKAGNVSEVQSTPVKIDITPPSAPTLTNSKNNTWSKDPVTVSMESTDEASQIATYEWYENGAWTDRAITLTDQKGSITYTSQRNETIRMRAVDNAGNVSSESTTIVKVDTTNPSASWSVNSSTAGSNSWYKALSLKATLSDSGSGVASAKYCTTTSSTCTPSTSATISSNSFTITLGSNASAQKICTQVTDNSGRTSSVACSSTYKVDTTNPTAKISASVSGNTITVSASGSSDSHSKIANYQYSRDNKTWYTSTATTYNFTGLADGTYTLYVKATDNSGRTHTVSTSAVVAYTNVYVSSSGNDSTGNGSSSKPYATLAKAYSKVKSGGNIILLSNITQSTAANFNTSSKTVTLKSNGSSKYQITRSSSLTSSPLINLSNKNTITITNVTLNGNNVSSTTALIRASGTCTVNLNSGTTVQNGNNTSKYAGGGVQVSGSSTLNINGATIKSNKTNNQGGGIYLNSSTLNLNSGTITGNSLINSTLSDAGGGGINAWNSTVNIKGGTISNNSGYNGGGVCVDGDSQSTFTMTAGTITGNKVVADGGGIWVKTENTSVRPKVTISGGTVSSNTSSNNGGGISLSYSDAQISNLTVNNNNAFQGGGMFILETSSVTLTNVNIRNNTATYGGGIAVINQGTAYLKSGYIQSNTATGNAGGVDINNGNFYMQGGNVINNKCNTANQIGGISGTGSYKYSYSSGTISGNTPINSNV